jgi:ATP-dependent DNA ligase
VSSIRRSIQSPSRRFATALSAFPTCSEPVGLGAKRTLFTTKNLAPAFGYSGPVDLPVQPPFPPMLAKLARRLPENGFRYEPKWDGFRALAFRDGDEVDLRSRNDRALARYFPELVEALLGCREARFVLDGEILVASRGEFDFPSLLARIHPAASRVERLRRETPASFVAFDVVAVGATDLRERRFDERRRLLEAAFREAAAGLFLTPMTTQRSVAERWLDDFHGGGIDGVVAKHADSPYTPGLRTMLKVKHERTADCVVGGFRWLADQPLPSSLLLGLYDAEHVLEHVGIASSFKEALRRQLVDVLRPRIVALEGHPWEHGFLVGGSPVGRLRGAAGRWTPEMTQDWTPIVPELVCEVTYDHLDGDRFRHPARFRRWRPDRDPESCTFEQLEIGRAPAELLAM